MSDLRVNEVSRDSKINGLLPVVESDIFQDSQDSHFWVGQVSDLCGPSIDDDTYNSVAKLRANVYIDEKRFLGEDSRRPDGTEADYYDSSSIQYASFENMGEGLVRPISCGRMIIKLTEDSRLPIENYFPEVFSSSPPDVGSVEISRFISRHPNKLTQHANSLAIIRAMTYRSVDIDAPKDYFLIEKPLFGMLSMIGLPVEQIGEEKDIPEQNGILYPIQADTREVLDLATNSGDSAAHAILQAFFDNEEDTRGEGFYPESLMKV